MNYKRQYMKQLGYKSIAFKKRIFGYDVQFYLGFFFKVKKYEPPHVRVKRAFDALSEEERQEALDILKKSAETKN